MKVFIVEDSTIVIARLINLFHLYDQVEIIGYSGNYADAAHEIARNKIDLALVDIRFPGGNGIDLIGLIRDKHPSAKIVMLSNYSLPQFKKKCKELGADYFFDKTKDIDSAINVTLGKHLEKTGFEGIP